MTFHFGDACAEDTPWHEPFRGRFDRVLPPGLIHGGSDRRLLGCGALAPRASSRARRGAIEHQPLFLAVHALCGPDVNRPSGASDARAVRVELERGHPGSHAEGVRKLEDALARAGFDAPDAAVERGYVYFADVDAAAAVVRAAPFFAELIADEGLHERYVRAVRSRLEEVESEIGGFERVDAEVALEGGWGVVEAAKKSGADVGGDVMIPAVAYFGHATAPWNVLGTKGEAPVPSSS